jgi:hypothetical protein
LAIINVRSCVLAIGDLTLRQGQHVTMCQLRHFASQQKVSLFDHLVSAGKHVCGKLICGKLMPSALAVLRLSTVYWAPAPAGLRDFIGESKKRRCSL